MVSYQYNQLLLSKNQVQHVSRWLKINSEMMQSKITKKLALKCAYCLYFLLLGYKN